MPYQVMYKEAATPTWYIVDEARVTHILQGNYRNVAEILRTMREDSCEIATPFAVYRWVEEEEGNAISATT